nr:ribonuclease H-like domain, reverse transcriptase, RNA-dependent DNA polymerase [Tanacetum cinerariifolium]
MIDLQFVDQHNMVACLERTDGNTEFHHMVDFLTSSTIHYALTLSPTIYASYIEQFWATVKALQLFLNNQIALEEPFSDVYVTPAHTKKVFTNMKRQNKDFSGTVTPLFATMLVPPVVEGEGSGQPSGPQPPSLTALPKQDLAIVSQPQKTQTHRRTKRGEDDRVVRAATTAASLEVYQESGNINKTQPRQHLMNHLLRELVQVVNPGAILPHWGIQMLKLDELTDYVPPTLHDPPLSGGHTPGSDEDCTRLGDQEVAKESQKIEKEANDKNSKDEALQDCGDAVNAASVIPDVSATSPSTSAAGPFTSTAEDIFEDEIITMVYTLRAIRRKRPRTTSLVIHDVEEEPRRATPPPIVQRQDKEIAQRLFEEEQAQFEREKRITKEKATKQEAKDAALIEQMEDVQARIDADALLAERLQREEKEQFTIGKQVRMLVDLIVERKKFFAA